MEIKPKDVNALIMQKKAKDLENSSETFEFLDLKGQVWIGILTLTIFLLLISSYRPCSVKYVVSGLVFGALFEISKRIN